MPPEEFKQTAKVDRNHRVVLSFPQLPPGTEVQLQGEIDSVPASPENTIERTAALASLSGVWRDDSSIEEAFETVLRDRMSAEPRGTDFDAAS
jgi:hypothetical protein